MQYILKVTKFFISKFNIPNINSKTHPMEYIHTHLDHLLEESLKLDLKDKELLKFLKDWKKYMVKSVFYIQEVKKGSIMFDIRTNKAYVVSGVGISIDNIKDSLKFPLIYYNAIILPLNINNEPSKIFLFSYLKENTEEIFTGNIEKILIDLIKRNEIIYSLKEEFCHKCNKLYEKLMRCSKCKTIKYCSAKCQKDDWEKHKIICNSQ